MNRSRYSRLRMSIVVLVFAIAFVCGGMTSTVNAVTKPTKMTITANSRTVDIKGHVKVYVKSVKPSKASRKVTYKSSNTKVATVSKTGVVIGKTSGKVKITVTSKYNKKVKKTVTITVKDLKSTSLTISKNELKLLRGSSYQLKSSIKGSVGYYNQGVVWSSDNPGVAEVSSRGSVNAVSEGTANITVTEKNGTRSRSCVVTVVGEPVVGEKCINYGDFEWNILDVQEGKALLITDKAADKYTFSKKMRVVTWADSDVRAYLNGEFLNKHFSDSDRSRMLEVNNSTPDNAWFGTEGGNDTIDTLFLLSLEELVKYYGDSGKLSAGRPVSKPDEEVNNQTIEDEYNEARILRDDTDKDVWWWLRSSGYDNTFAGIVSRWGFIYVRGEFVNKAYGIRPAVWVNLNE